MGARFAPPFAIVYMAAIEKLAVDVMNKKGYRIEYYTRYIDDTLMVVQIEKNQDIVKEEILNIFNSVTPEIQFTIETQAKGSRMPFLDTELYVEGDKINYGWYIKGVHSGNLMRVDAYAPKQMKDNFIINSFCRIFTRCNNSRDTEVSVNKMYKLLQKNGYDPLDINKGLKKAVHKFNSNSERVKWDKGEAIFKMQFKSDLVNKGAKSLLSGMGVKLVNKKFIRLSSLNPKLTNNTNRCTCNICIMVGDKFSCNTKQVVYKYTCLGCQECYIGKTINSVKDRHKQHRAAMVKLDANKSALVEHMSNCSYAFDKDIEAYKLSILEKCNDNVDTLIREAWWINKLSPKLNRKNELAYKYY
jgi:hypothetical protein